MIQLLGDTLDDEHADLAYREYEEGRRDGFRNGVLATIAVVFIVIVVGASVYTMWR